MNNSVIYNFCCSNDTKYVKILLSNFDDIDVFYKNGILFDIAISNNNIKICEALFEYFETKQFSIKNTDYDKAKEKLTEILENAIDGIDLSTEMQEVLRPYVNFDNSFEDRLNDSLLNEIDLPVEREDGNNTILTEEVLNDFQEQIKIVGKSSPTYTDSTHDNYHDNDNQEVKIGGDHETDNL
jgi:hypothetical protein